MCPCVAEYFLKCLPKLHPRRHYCLFLPVSSADGGAVLIHQRSRTRAPRFFACFAGRPLAIRTRKTNAAFGVACFSFVLIILQHFTSFVHCFPTRGTFYEKGSCKAGFSACGGSRKRHSSIPPQCDPRGAFLSYGNEVSYTMKKNRQL